MTDEQTDQDLRIVGHPFAPGRPPLEEDDCGHDVGGMPCGFSRAEHADQGGQL